MSHACNMYKYPTDQYLAHFAIQRRCTCNDNGDDDNDKGGNDKMFICLVGFNMYVIIIFITSSPFNNYFRDDEITGKGQPESYVRKTVQVLKTHLML